MKLSANVFFKHFEEILCSVFLVTMIGLVIVNVFLRYLFNYSIFWAEEVATICFVWLVFIGASATYKHKMDIGIDILITKTPEQVEKMKMTNKPTIPLPIFDNLFLK